MSDIFRILKIPHYINSHEKRITKYLKLVSQCNLSAAIPFKLVDSHLIAMKFTDGIAWMKRITKTRAVRQIAMCNSSLKRLEYNYFFRIADTDTCLAK